MLKAQGPVLSVWLTVRFPEQSLVSPKLMKQLTKHFIRDADFFPEVDSKWHPPKRFSPRPDLKCCGGFIVFVFCSLTEARTCVAKADIWAAF